MLGCFALFLYPINGAPPKIRNEKDPKGSRKMSTTQQEQTRAAAPQEYLLEMRGITKAFAGVQALKGVDFYVRPGTVHVFLLDDPTRGIDVGAKYEIYQLIFDLAKQNKGVIICSSEMPELLGICDRVLVLSSGHLTGEYDLVHDREHATQENIMVDATKFV